MQNWILTKWPVSLMCPVDSCVLRWELHKCDAITLVNEVI